MSVKIGNFTYYIDYKKSYNPDGTINKEVILTPANQKFTNNDNASSKVLYSDYEYTHGGRIYKLAVEKAKEIFEEVKDQDIFVEE